MQYYSKQEPNMIKSEYETKYGGTQNMAVCINTNMSYKDFNMLSSDTYQSMYSNRKPARQEVSHEIH